MSEPKRIIDITRSPMNPKRWMLTLECGHEVWITASRRPERRSMRCARCAALAEPRKETVQHRDSPPTGYEKYGD